VFVEHEASEDGVYYHKFWKTDCSWTYRFYDNNFTFQQNGWSSSL